MDEFKIEDGFKELEDILSDLADQDVGLDESMELYKKGVEILKKCNIALDKTEKELVIIQQEGSL